MVNAEKLKKVIAEKNMTIEGIAIDMKKDRSTLYRHFENDGDKMTIIEIKDYVHILGLTKQEAIDIFLPFMSQI